MYRIANEFKTRIDEWFKWRDVFIVGLEYCSTNILKISLRAVNVEVVSPNGKKWIASELHPIGIKIPFDLLGDLLDAVQKHSNYRIIGAINNNEFDFIYIIIEEKSWWNQLQKKQVKNLTCIFYSLSDTLNLISSDVSDSKFSTLGLIQTSSSFFAFLERKDLDFFISSSRT